MSDENTSTDERTGDRRDALGGARPVERGSFRDRIRRKPGLGLAWRAGVFIAGLVLILGGLALAVLPGPLTIPPVLLGLWLWNTEFEWAHRFFLPFQEKGKAAWEHAKRHPVSSTAITLAGLVAAGAAFWAVYHFQLIDRAKDALGI